MNGLTINGLVPTYVVVLIFPLNGQMAMLLLMVAQERFNSYHFEKDP